jgi:hypothetical protein
MIRVAVIRVVRRPGKPLGKLGASLPVPGTGSVGHHRDRDCGTHGHGHWHAAAAPLAPLPGRVRVGPCQCLRIMDAASAQAGSH